MTKNKLKIQAHREPQRKWRNTEQFKKSSAVLNSFSAAYKNILKARAIIRLGKYFQNNKGSFFKGPYSLHH